MAALGGERENPNLPPSIRTESLPCPKVKMQNKSVDPALRAALVGQHNNPGRPCSIHIGPLPKTQECKTSPYRPLLWPPSVENPNNPCTAPSIRTGSLPQRRICKTNLLEQMTLWPLGGEPEEPRPASINSRNIASTKVRMQQSPWMKAPLCIGAENRASVDLPLPVLSVQLAGQA